ncbi:MAG: hypothetical protein ACOY3X_11260 [Pseudomonadota bacterium]
MSRVALIAALALTLAVPAQAADKKAAAPAAAPAAEAPANNNEILAEKARADKKALVATNMALTETEAKAFWPLYEEYQKGLADLNTRGLKAIVDFAQAQKGGALPDDSAKKLIDDMLATEQAEADLRKTMAPKLLKVLPPMKAARYLQLENKVRAAVRAQLAARIPLVGDKPAAAAAPAAAKPAGKP